MAVCWHSLSEHFTAKKIKHFNLYYPQKGKKPKKKKKKIPEEENGLERERAHARHLDLQLYALIQCATYTLTLSAPNFKALTFHAIIGYFSIELFWLCRKVFFIKNYFLNDFYLL